MSIDILCHLWVQTNGAKMKRKMGLVVAGLAAIAVGCGSDERVAADGVDSGDGWGVVDGGAVIDAGGGDGGRVVRDDGGTPISPLDGGVLPAASVSPLAATLGQLRALAVDDTNAFLLAAGAGGQVVSCSAANCGATTLVRSALAAPIYGTATIDAFGGRVYFNEGAQLRRASADGSSLQSIPTGGTLFVASPFVPVGTDFYVQVQPASGPGAPANPPTFRLFSQAALTAGTPVSLAVTGEAQLVVEGNRRFAAPIGAVGPFVGVDTQTNATWSTPNTKVKRHGVGATLNHVFFIDAASSTLRVCPAATSCPSPSVALTGSTFEELRIDGADLVLATKDNVVHRCKAADVAAGAACPALKYVAAPTAGTTFVGFQMNASGYFFLRGNAAGGGELVRLPR